MPFHPEVSAFLTLLKSIAAPPLHTLPVDQARQSYDRGTQAFGGPTLEMDSVEDLTIAGIPCRLYRPHGLPPGPAPTVIFFHGGGWTIGSLASHDKVCRNLAAATPSAVLAVDYRLGPEHPIPAAQIDAIAVTLWLATHAASLNLDPTRLAVAGDSAGGGCAAAAAVAARDAAHTLRAQLLIYPSIDARATAELYPSRIANAEMPLLDTATKHYFGRHSRDQHFDESDPRLTLLLTPSLAALPPALIVTAGLDILHDEAVLYGTQLEQAGVEVLHRNFPGLVHGFLTLGGVLSASRDTIETAALFLRQRLLPITS